MNFEDGINEKTDLSDELFIENNKMEPSFFTDDIGSEDFSSRLSVDRLRFVLMLFVSINCFGVFGGMIGKLIQIVCGFAVPAFFIISGYLVLDPDDCQQKILRTLKRSAVTFAVMTVAYFLINAVFYAIGGINIFTASNFSSRRFWFNFLILNYWPYSIGGIIWYVQALFYAYVIIYFLNKFNLLRFDWLIFAVLTVFSVITGELSGVIKLNLFEYRYLPNGFLTYALPCLMLGSFIRRKRDFFCKTDNLFYLLISVAGVVISVAEVLIISGYSVLITDCRFLGNVITAFGICIPRFSDARIYTAKRNYVRERLNTYYKIIYYLLQPISVIIVYAFSFVSAKSFSLLINWVWLMAFVLTAALAVLITFVIDLIFNKSIIFKKGGAA